MTAPADLAALSIDQFLSLRDADFELKAAGRITPLKLVKIDNIGNSGRAGGAFSLLFAAPNGPALAQGIYSVQHAAVGVMEIFLVPIGPLGGGVGYQAIFT